MCVEPTQTSLCVFSTQTYLFYVEIYMDSFCQDEACLLHHGGLLLHNQN
jgi:hypothetical protein